MRSTCNVSKTQIRRWILPILIVVVLLAYFVYVLVDRHKIVSGTSAINGAIVTNTEANPSEKKPKCNEYKTDVGYPKRISIPSIDTDGCIVRLGIDQNNAVASPNNVHLAGWFTGSALPGEPGVSLIDGHVSGRYSPGVFKNLSKLKPHDAFTVTFGDNSKKNFQVVSVNEYSVSDTKNWMLKPRNNIKHQLNLVTCTGSFNSKTNQYDQRVVVVSKAIE